MKITHILTLVALTQAAPIEKRGWLKHFLDSAWRGTVDGLEAAGKVIVHTLTDAGEETEQLVEAAVADIDDEAKAIFQKVKNRTVAVEEFVGSMFDNIVNATEVKFEKFVQECENSTAVWYGYD